MSESASEESKYDLTEARDLICRAADKYKPNIPARRTAAIELMRALVTLSIDGVTITNEGDFISFATPHRALQLRLNPQFELYGQYAYSPNTFQISGLDFNPVTGLLDGQTKDVPPQKRSGVAVVAEQVIKALVP